MCVCVSAMVEAWISSSSGSSSHRKSKHVAVKLLLSALLIGLSFRLFLSRSDTSVVAASSSSSFAGRKDSGDATTKGAVVAVDAPTSAIVSEIEEISQKEKCDLFTGEWIQDPSGPAYTNESCHFIETPQNCMTNGRPDRGYLFWRWKPYGCDVPLFDPEFFLDSMRHKSWALIGDSILRNHVQSLMCLISKVEEPVEVYHDETFKSRRWHFRSHNFTLSLIWTPFLIKADVFENEDGISKSDNELHLDMVDTNWTKQYNNFDYVVISTGQWFLKTAIYWENNTVIGCHYCKGRNLTEIGYDYAFRKALEASFLFITSSAHKPVVFYRTWTPSHFENGEWFSGGTCNRTRPFKRGEVDGKDGDLLMRGIEVDEFQKAVANDGPENAGRLKLLDTFELSLLRPDGHSGPYRKFHPFEKVGKSAKVQNDCLHWCLPGPVDNWNDLMMQMLMKN